VFPPRGYRCVGLREFSLKRLVPLPQVGIIPQRHPRNLALHFNVRHRRLELGL
jgi:hypothetical protein